MNEIIFFKKLFIFSRGFSLDFIYKLIHKHVFFLLYLAITSIIIVREIKYIRKICVLGRVKYKNII